VIVASLDAIMTTYKPTRERFGAGGIVGDALGVFFQRFGLMFALSLVPAVIGFLITAAFTSVLPAMGAGNPTAGVAAAAVLTIVGILFPASLSNSLIVLAAFDAKIGRPGRFGLYVQRALANLFTVVFLSIVCVLLIVTPILLLAAPTLASPTGSGTAGVYLIILGILIGFYLWSAFAPLVPVIVIEEGRVSARSTAPGR
jgi:hypothetical protein